MRDIILGGGGVLMITLGWILAGVWKPHPRRKTRHNGRARMNDESPTHLAVTNRPNSTID